MKRGKNMSGQELQQSENKDNHVLGGIRKYYCATEGLYWQAASSVKPTMRPMTRGSASVVCGHNLGLVQKGPCLQVSLTPPGRASP